MKQVLYLVDHGVPFDIAISLDDVELHAFIVMIGENNGGHYSWSNLRFENPG